MSSKFEQRNNLVNDEEKRQAAEEHMTSELEELTQKRQQELREVVTGERKAIDSGEDEAALTEAFERARERKQQAEEVQAQDETHAAALAEQIKSGNFTGETIVAEAPVNNTEEALVQEEQSSKPESGAFTLEDLKLHLQKKEWGAIVAAAKQTKNFQGEGFTPEFVQIKEQVLSSLNMQIGKVLAAYTREMMRNESPGEEEERERIKDQYIPLIAEAQEIIDKGDEKDPAIVRIQGLINSFKI